MTDALALHGVAKRFGEHPAVDDVSLRLGPNELLALVGPSGCGKSTLLRMVAGLEPIDSGVVELAGVVVDDGRRVTPPERRHVGLVFQEHALFPHLSVAKNIAFGVRGAELDPARRVAEMLELVGLAGYGDRYPHELSGGERQRVALARALAPAPSILLLDEPFASLDPNLRHRLRADVADILRTTGTPALFVTHDQGEALAIGDRVAVMRGGRLAQVGSPQDVFHRPVDRFVASFMGEARFLDAAVAQEQITGLRLPAGTPRDATVMLRPDDVTFDLDGGAGAVVLGAEYRGSTWCYTLRLPSGDEIRSTRTHLRHVEPGARVHVEVRDGHEPVVLPDAAE